MKTQLHKGKGVVTNLPPEQQGPQDQAARLPTQEAAPPERPDQSLGLTTMPSQPSPLACIPTPAPCPLPYSPDATMWGSLMASAAGNRTRCLSWGSSWSGGMTLTLTLLEHQRGLSWAVSCGGSHRRAGWWGDHPRQGPQIRHETPA